LRAAESMFMSPSRVSPYTFRIEVSSLSPEDGERLDLTDFTRRFMKQVERDTGRPLVWAAVNHHNTDNPHVHIVVPSRLRFGFLRFARTYRRRVRSGRTSG
jgi:type IV secretory pathway VirD2 relaxase